MKSKEESYKIDSRRRSDILNQMQMLAQSYTPEWKFDTTSPDAGSVIGLIFANQTAANIQKLNRVIEKYHTEFKIREREYSQVILTEVLEIHIVELLRFNLENNGYKVDYSYDGFDGYLKTKEFQPDLILLDWMLPNISGIELLKKIRSDESLEQIPVIMLTAKNMEEDKLEGLQDGADDYITKPFSVKEVLARITSVLRRYKYTSNEKVEVLKADDIQVNVNKHIVTKNGQEIELTLKEFQILKLLIENKGNVLTRTFLLDKIWGYDYYGETRTLDVHIRHLRKKIGDNDSKLIETVRGVGYKIK